MRIATWNVNSVRTRLPHIISWIKEARPDVLLLQELKALNEHFPAEGLEELGYNIAIHGQKTYNGVAILSKYPLEDVQRGLPGDDNDLEARYIEAFTHKVRVASIYVPNGQEVGSLKYAYKLAFLKRLKSHMETLLSYGEALVLGGDYNIAPKDEDVYDPLSWEGSILCSPAERAAFQTLMNLGVTDALRTCFPPDHPEGKKLYTWWDYRAGSWPRNKGLRIDHLLLSPQAAALLKGAGVDTSPRGLERPSDHAPVWCDLREES